MGNTMPEDLPPELPIKEIEKRLKPKKIAPPRLPLSPPAFGGLARDLLAALRRHALCSRLPAHPAKRYGGGVLAVIGDLVLDLAGRHPHDVQQLLERFFSCPIGGHPGRTIV